MIERIKFSSLIKYIKLYLYNMLVLVLQTEKTGAVITMELWCTRRGRKVLSQPAYIKGKRYVFSNKAKCCVLFIVHNYM